MEQQNNTAALNDTAGVLPMDTDVTANGIHDEGDNNPLVSNNGNAKKGRGRPPKSAGSTKVTVSSDTPKRARGRPPKTGETTPVPTKVPVLKEKKEEISTNGDESKKRRGRPSKTDTPNVPVNGISKLHVQPPPVSIYKEIESDEDEPEKRKRGRPSGASPKKAVVIATPAAPKAASSTRKRGRPSGSARAKKPAPKPTVAASNDGSAKKRGRPKKAGASPTSVATTPANEITATVTPNNV